MRRLRSSSLAARSTNWKKSFWDWWRAAMASNNVFQPVVEHGWRVGFNNLFRKENRDWWGTRSWLTQAIIWTAILIGILATVLFTPMEDAPAGGKAVLGLTVFFMMAGIALPIGVIIMGQ